MRRPRSSHTLVTSKPVDVNTSQASGGTAGRKRRISRDIENISRKIPRIVRHDDKVLTPTDLGK
jgi:hypothetical protein